MKYILPPASEIRRRRRDQSTPSAGGNAPETLKGVEGREAEAKKRPITGKNPAFSHSKRTTRDCCATQRRLIERLASSVVLAVGVLSLPVRNLNGFGILAMCRFKSRRSGNSLSFNLPISSVGPVTFHWNWYRSIVRPILYLSSFWSNSIRPVFIKIISD